MIFQDGTKQACKKTDCHALNTYGITSLFIFALLLIVPANASAEDRVERIESRLQAMEQKLEALIKENMLLKERVKASTGQQSEGAEQANLKTPATATESEKNQTAHIETPQTTSETQQSASIDALQQENVAILDRLDDVESIAEETAFKFGNLVDISGYADVEYYGTTQPGTNSKFRIRHFSLFFAKEIQDDWSLFSEIEFEDAPFIESIHTANTAKTVQGKFLVEQMYIKYNPSIDWDILAGRYLTPAGIWNVYHYYPYVLTQERPFMVRVLFPQFADGLQLRKTFSLGDSLLDAHLYVANGVGNPGRLDRNVSKAVGAKLNFSPDFSFDMQVGASYYRDKDNLNVIRTTSGAHFMFDYDNLSFQAELAIRQNSPLNALKFKDMSAYGQVTYDIGKWTVGGRYDWFKANSLLPLTNKYRTTAAVNYHFSHNVLGKLEYNLNTFDDPAIPRWHEVIAAITVAIGDL